MWLAGYLFSCSENRSLVQCFVCSCQYLTGPLWANIVLYCIVLYLYIYIALLAVHANQKRLQALYCKYNASLNLNLLVYQRRVSAMILVRITIAEPEQCRSQRPGRWRLNSIESGLRLLPWFPYILTQRCSSCHGEIMWTLTGENAKRQKIMMNWYLPSECIFTHTRTRTKCIHV